MCGPILDSSFTVFYVAVQILLFDCLQLTSRIQLFALLPSALQ